MTLRTVVLTTKTRTGPQAEKPKKPAQISSPFRRWKRIERHQLKRTMINCVGGNMDQLMATPTGDQL